MDVTNAPAASSAVSAKTSKHKDGGTKAPSGSTSSSSDTASSKVSLSHAAKQAHAADSSKSTEKASGTTPGVESKNAAAAAEAQKADDDAAAAKDGSPIKSLAYGTLGLQSPEEAKQNTDSWYSVGKWVGAGLTIGGIISLFL